MKKGSKKSLLVVALLLLVGVTAYFGANTYAKYASEITGNNGTVTVAKWAFATDNEAQTLTIALNGTINANSLINDRIAPGTNGSFKVQLVNTNTETGVNWTVKLNSITGKPTNLKFYKNSDFTEELTPGTSTITGQLAAKDSTGIEVPVYWRWEFGTSDAVNDTINAADTTDGETPAELTIGLDIVGVQTNPTETVTTHMN